MLNNLYFSLASFASFASFASSEAKEAKEAKEFTIKIYLSSSSGFCPSPPPTPNFVRRSTGFGKTISNTTKKFYIQ